MTYERIKDLKSADFKRLCGVVRPETFAQMVDIVRTRRNAPNQELQPSLVSRTKSC
jgi:hypothetical protein